MTRLAALLVVLATLASAKSYLIRSARMYDGTSNSLASPGLVLVTDDRIVAIGPAAQAALPTGVETIDLGDATLLPGLMDAHVHLSSVRSGDTNRDRVNFLVKTTPERTLEASVYARQTLMAGFTSVRELGSSQYIDRGLRNSIRNGTIPGPRMLITIRSLGSIGGHSDSTNDYYGVEFPDTFFTKFGMLSGPDAFRAAVRTVIKNGADLIKFTATGGVLSLNEDGDSPQLTQAECDALIEQAHSMGRKVAAHAHGAEGAKRAIRAGVDSIEHGSFLDNEALELMKSKGTFLVPTLIAGDSVAEDTTKLDPRVLRKANAANRLKYETFASALAKGVRIAFGTDAGVFQHGRNAEEFELLAKGGMKPIDTLRAATSTDAELFGLKDLGALAPGKIADVVAVRGNPVESIRQMRQVFFVMKEGVVHRHDR